MTIGDLAAIHEFGDGMIPMRAPVRRWADSAARMVIQRRILKVANRQVRAQKFDRNQWYRVIRQAVNSMQSRIVAGKITPKNELSTLANKAPEERPLIESKQMVNAMRAEVELRQLGGLAGSRGFRTKAMGEGA